MKLKSNNLSFNSKKMSQESPLLFEKTDLGNINSKASNQIQQTLDYFKVKYSRNFELLQNLQIQRKNEQTPLKEARRAFQDIEDTESIISTRFSHNRKKSQNHMTTTQSISSSHSQRVSKHKYQQTTKPKGFYNTFTSTFQQNNQNSTFQYNQVYSLDIINIKNCLQQLVWIQDFLCQNTNETPNFQNLWEIWFELQIEQYIELIKNVQTYKIVKQCFLLHDISIGLMQCVLKNIYQHQLPYKNQILQDLKALINHLIESFGLFINKLITFQKNQNNNLWVQEVKDLLENIFCKTILTYNLKTDLSKNNSIIEILIKNILDKYKQNELITQNSPLYPIFTTTSYGLKHIHTAEITSIQIENANSQCHISISNPLLSISFQTQNNQKIQSLHSPLKTLYSSKDFIQEPLQQHFQSLQPVNSPFLANLNQDKKLTLVLDLDETLGHYTEGQFNLRPGVDEFLKKTNEHYEIVIFTAGVQEYADQIIDELDKERLIKTRLYRQHTKLQGNTYVKDLSELGRPLSRVVMVDNSAINFSLQPENGIIINSWYDDPEDKELFKMGSLLKKIAQTKTNDIRKALRRYRDFVTRMIYNGINYVF